MRTPVGDSVPKPLPLAAAEARGTGYLEGNLNLAAPVRLTKLIAAAVCDRLNFLLFTPYMFFMVNPIAGFRMLG
jgi:hypothetical protein